MRKDRRGDQNVSAWQVVLTVLAGLWAGTINTVVGSGTLVSFPVLLAVGLSPVIANISNTVGLFPGSLVGAYGYRRELAGQGRRAILLSVAAVLGAVAGALLLLVLPHAAFDAIVPVLIGLALVLVVFGKRINAWLAARGRHASEHVTVGLWIAMLLTGVYGGYFGAAQGVLQMGLFGVFLKDDIQRHNARVNWVAAGLIAVGSIAGGVLGARIGRRLPPNVLRGVIVVVGVAAMVKLLV
jgi:hypothetical protein